VAEVDVGLIVTNEGWSPYLSLKDAYKLDDVREALRRGDIEFENGNYTFWQCSGHVEEDTGRYEVVKSEGDVIVLALLDRSGNPCERGEIKLIINREDDTLIVQRGKLFVRGNPLK
jgi:hypothetical protein